MSADKHRLKNGHYVGGL